MNVITRLPLSSLTTPNGHATCIGDVGADTVRTLLKAGVVRFVIADVGAPLHWVPEAECYNEWKREVQPHLVEPGRPLYLERFPDEYAYHASWWDDGSSPIIVLSKKH